MTLQVLGVEVSLVTMRAREFTIRILGGDGGALRAPIDTVGDGSSTARNTRENTTAALRAHDLRAWRFLGPIRRAVGTVHIGSHAPGFPTVGVAESTGWETVEVATVTRRGRSDGLGVTLRGRRGRQHALGWWGV